MPAGTECLVRVVDERGNPIAGASVRLLDLGEIYARAPDLWFDGLDLEALSARLGTSFVADEEGLVRVPRSKAGGMLTAEVEGLFGLAEFGPGMGESETLVLRPDRSLAVRVVDARGTPAAGVPVALRLSAGDRVETLLRATTEADGCARLAHLQEAIDGGEEGTVPAEVGSVAVALALLLPAPVSHVLRPGPFPMGPIELVLPPTGSLEILLQDAEGRLLATDARVTLELVPDGPKDADEEWGRKYLPGADSLILLARNGQVLVERVGLALGFKIQVTPYEEFRPTEALAHGPGRADELAVVRVPVLERVPVLSATLLAPDGAPLSRRQVSANLWMEAGSRGGGRFREVETDEVGRFELALRNDWPLDGRCTLELWSDDSDGRRGWLRLVKEPPLEPGKNELGALVLPFLPVLAAGLVLDPTGAPIAGAEVRLTTPIDGLNRGWIVSDLSAEDGSFVLQAPLDARQVELEASQEGFVSRLFPVEVGRQDLSLTLAFSGSLAGTVLVGHEQALQDLRMVITNDSGARREVDLNEDGTFVSAGLAPGPYDVRLELTEEPEFAQEVPGVLVEAGVTCRDPRVQVIDLRGRLRTFTITMQGPENKSVYDFFVQRRPSGMGSYPVGKWTRDETLTTSYPALDLRLTARGCRTEEILGVAENRTLGLHQALGFQVKLVRPILLNEGESIELMLENRGGAVINDYYKTHFWDGETAEALVPEPGNYVARLQFLQQTIGDMRATPLPLEPETVLRIEEQDQPQRFVLTLSPAALREVARARADPPPKAQ
jgi:hypothetical protein